MIATVSVSPVCWLSQSFLTKRFFFCLCNKWCQVLKLGEQKTVLALLTILVSLLAVVPVVGASGDDSWYTLTSAPMPRSGHGVAVVDDILYAIGGYNLETETRLDANDAYVPVGYTGDFVPPDYVSPVVTVDAPMNATYATSDVSLSFVVDEDVSWMGYSLDGEDNVTTTENTVTLTGLPNGVHNITVYANDTSENTGTSETIYFTVDVPPASWTTTAIILAAVAAAGAAIIIVYAKTRKNRTHQKPNSHTTS